MFDAACRRLASWETKNKSLPRQLPSCWPGGIGKKGLRKIVAPGSTAGGDVYASEPFMWKLYDDQRPETCHPLDAQASFRFAKLLERRLPGWEPLFRSKWTASDLLTGSGNIADAAFLSLVKMYKNVLGKHFPTGVFDWPPTVWLQSYQEGKGRKFDCHRAHPETSRAEPAGCQPKPTGESRTPSVQGIPKSARHAEPIASGRLPKSATAPQSKPPVETLTEALCRGRVSSTASGSKLLSTKAPLRLRPHRCLPASAPLRSVRRVPLPSTGASPSRAPFRI